ncbi:transmembrane 4 L6 family member 1 [Ambystoma mexicanum]|uniref:transmembrane 4 L6 family member 1 n=1 Tax=Ambystoma mexicanum TaxID=8296 RepID=UPI0037E88176
MCFGKCARCIGSNLLYLAILCIIANLLLYFPNGETKYASEGHLTSYVWYFHGLVGAGLLIFLPASVFIALERENCCGCCGHQNCGKGCAMFSSILAAVIGLAGSAYCVVVSAVALARGPLCLDSASQWRYVFLDTNGGYLTDHASWSECIEPKNVVTWNVTLFSILLGLAGIEFILCLIQIINGLIGGICSCCGCRNEQQSYAC